MLHAAHALMSDDLRMADKLQTTACTRAMQESAQGTVVSVLLGHVAHGLTLCFPEGSPEGSPCGI